MPKVLTAGSLRAWSVYGELNLRGLGSTLALLRVFNLGGIKSANVMRNLTGVFKTFTKVASIGLLAFGAAVSGTIRAFSTFDSAMTQSLAIMGDMSDMMRGKLEMAARKIGKTMQFTAAQAAEGYFFLASAGFSVAQSLAALPAVANFAQAGMFDLATATDLATDAQSALGLRVDDAAENLKNMVRVTDVLVTANRLANATVEQFSETITNKFGARLRLLNISMEEGVAVAAALADQGVKGRIAGQRLTIVYRDLAIASLKSSDAFEKMGVEVFDAKGEMNTMADIVEQLDENMEGLAPKQKIMRLETLGLNKRAADALALLLGLSDQMREYRKELDKAAGATETIAQKQLGAFKLQLLKTKREVIDLAIQIGGNLAPQILAMAEAFRIFVSSIDAEAVAKSMSDMLTAVLNGFADMLELTVNLMEEIQLSIPQIASFGLIGLIIMGPQGMAGLIIIAAGIRKLYGMVDPSKLSLTDQLIRKRKALQNRQHALAKQFVRLGDRIADPNELMDKSVLQEQLEFVLSDLQNANQELMDMKLNWDDLMAAAEGASTRMARILIAGIRAAADAQGALGAGFGAISGEDPSDELAPGEFNALVKTDIEAGFPLLHGGLSSKEWGTQQVQLMLEAMNEGFAFEAPLELSETDIKLDIAFDEMAAESKRQAKTIGKGIINGIVDGSLSMKDVLKQVLKGILNIAMGGLFSFLDIGSPSKLTMGIGRNITMGLVDGILSEKARLADAMMELGHVVASGASGIGVGGIPAGALGLTSGAPRGLGSLDLSKMPAAKNPLDSHRDSEWQEWMRNSMLHAEDNGFRFERIGRR